MTAAPFDIDNEIAESFVDLIGRTPMMYLRGTMRQHPACKATIAVKLETENPMGSVKDRLALGIILKNEAAGIFKPGETVIVESTSGNTGISLAQLGAVRGYRVIITMPETMSMERRCLLKIFGAELVLTPASLGMRGAMRKALEIYNTTPHACLVQQFTTPFNAQIHYETTGPEIWRQTHGKVDAVVIGTGTGGTLTGVARYLLEKNPNIKIIAVEPAESPVIAGGKPGPHKIQGIGPGFVPDTLDVSLISEVIAVSTADAVRVAKYLPSVDGVFGGFSTGANVCAALWLGERPDMEGKLVVAFASSYGERYLSTSLFEDIREDVLSLSVISASELN
jgi:cysteine synthase A